MSSKKGWLAEFLAPIKKALGFGSESEPAIPVTTKQPVVDNDEVRALPGLTWSPATFKRPDSWIEEGRALQCGVGGDLVLRLGLDFGTAYTKLAIGLRDQVHIVDWSGLHNVPGEILLPGELSELTEGTFVGRAAGASRYSDNLKLPFLGKTPVTDDPAQENRCREPGIFIAINEVCGSQSLA